MKRTAFVSPSLVPVLERTLAQELNITGIDAICYKYALHYEVDDMLNLYFCTIKEHVMDEITEWWAVAETTLCDDQFTEEWVVIE